MRSRDAGARARSATVFIGLYSGSVALFAAALRALAGS
jgi:hypothetical protein